MDKNLNFSSAYSPLALSTPGAKTWPEVTLVNSLSAQALDGLASFGSRYEAARDSIRAYTREQEDAVSQLFNLQQQIRNAQRGKNSISGLQSSLDALSGVGDALVIFSKEHSAGNTRYPKTLEAMVKTTGQLGLSSGLGIAGTALATSVFGVGFVSFGVGLAVATAGYLAVEKALSHFGYTE